MDSHLGNRRTVNSNHVNAETVASIAIRIARCDFRVTMSRYITSLNSPWVITVGESEWRRRLVVEKSNEDGTEATLGILSDEGFEGGNAYTNSNEVVRQVSLKDLVANNYMSVKKALKEEPVPA